VVEAAVALPLLIVVALALIQFALFAHAQNVVTGAVQDGTRVAAAEDGNLAAGIESARELLVAGLGWSAGEMSVVGQASTDTVTLEAEGRLPLIVPWLGEAGLPLHSQSTLIKERFRNGPVR
jgi:Flp pilus assembly protein TadG